MWRFESGIPVDVLVCDWQLAKVFNPLADLSFMLFTCCGSTTRKNCQDQMLECYVEKVRNVLHEMGLNMNVSFDELVSSYKQDGIFWGLLNLVFLAPAVADLKASFCALGAGTSSDNDLFYVRYLESVLESAHVVIDNVKCGAWL